MRIPLLGAALTNTLWRDAITAALVSCPFKHNTLPASEIAGIGLCAHEYAKPRWRAGRRRGCQRALRIAGAQCALGGGRCLCECVCVVVRGGRRGRLQATRERYVAMGAPCMMRRHHHRHHQCCAQTAVLRPDYCSAARQQTGWASDGRQICQAVGEYTV